MDTDRPTDICITRARMEIKILAHFAPCEVCGHERKRARCAYCSARRRCPPCADPDCSYCFAESLASVIRDDAWDDALNLPRTPRNVWKNSMVKVWIRCPSCERASAKRAALVGKHGCSLCVNKTELKLYKWLESHYSTISHQARFDWSGSRRTI